MYNVLMSSMITLAGILGSILLLLFSKRKTTRPPSKEYNKVDGDDKTSSSDASIANLPDGESYEVFLSFTGEDTLKYFTYHLYQSLVDAGVRVFGDDGALRVGVEIGPELDQVIRASKISIPIISPNYASSIWCLQELVRILECMKSARQLVLPIFYHVDPSGVRNQTGTLREAFRSHIKKYGSNSKVVQEWKNALKEVSSLKGWESSKIADGHEGELVKIVVTYVLDNLGKRTLDVPDCLVGIEDHKKLILKMVKDTESSDAQALVIHGMDGVGKTTLAKVVYDELSAKFKHCTFLPNIRERLTGQKCRPEDLQEQLISDILGCQWPRRISNVDEGINIIKYTLKKKKVLILLDDADHSHQLNALAGDRSWFKSGSILIITTRNKDVLNGWEEGRLTYELNGLDHSLSFLLFCRHAFRRDDCPLLQFCAIAEDIVSTTGGLPLAIEVIGSMLFGKSKAFWEGVFKKLQYIHHLDVQEQLRITYDSLEYEQKQILLDIACLPIQNEVNFACYMWNDCVFHPKSGIKELISLSLIKIGQENQVIISDQLRNLGRAIVREEGYPILGNQSRIWDEKTALREMQRNQGMAKTEALNLFFDYDKFEGERNFTSEQFKGMRKLRFLRLRNVNLVGDFYNLLLDLRWLQLEGSPWHFVSPPTNLVPTKLVVLNLSYSSITEHWEGWAQVKLVNKLKVLKLHCCYALRGAPDFSAFEKLEILILSGCRNLQRIHPSICYLNKTLLTLDVTHCKKLAELPNEMGEMEEIRQLLIDGTLIRTIPISKGYMTKLENLSAGPYRYLQHLPDFIRSLMNLVPLSLSDCHSLTMISESIGT